jgi:hypothetical protein
MGQGLLQQKVFHQRRDSFLQPLKPYKVVVKKIHCKYLAYGTFVYCCGFQQMQHLYLFTTALIGEEILFMG